MAGCGVGFSVESRYVENFPRIQRQRGCAPLRHVGRRLGPGLGRRAVRLGMEAWFEGGDVDFNFSQIRPAGAPLRTKGGRASGPGAAADDARVHPRARAGAPGHAPAPDRRPRHHVHGRQRRRQRRRAAHGDDLAVRLRRSRDAPVQERRLRARQQPALERQQLGRLARARPRPDPGHRAGPGHGQVAARRAGHFQPQSRA